MQEIIIDATNATLGRMASYVAKQALLGKKVIILNSERAIVTGRKKFTIKIVKGEKYSSNDSEYININFKKYIDPDININIEFVDYIPTTKAGKRCFVKSEVPKFLWL